MELLAFWLLCGILAGIIASSKGGSGFLGFVVGALLGPIGVIISLFMGNSKNLAEKAVVSGEMKKCPQCAELVLAEAKICKHCGSAFAS
jgi:zinc-ribbon domain